MQIPLEQRHNTDGCDKCRWIRVEGWGLTCLGMAGGETASEMAPCKDTKLQEPIEGLLWDWKTSVAGRSGMPGATYSASDLRKRGPVARKVMWWCTRPTCTEHEAKQAGCVTQLQS